jgi:integrase
MHLVHDAKGQPFTLAALRKRFDRLGLDWQIRDLRAKAASDSDDARAAQTLLGHAAASTTDGYIRQNAGARARPVNRRITDKPS